MSAAVRLRDHFEAAVDEAADHGEVDTNRGGDELSRLARQLDQTANDLVTHARHVGREFTRYADRVAEGIVHESTPVGSSSVLDVAVLAGKYAALLAAFKDAFYVATKRHFRERAPVPPVPVPAFDADLSPTHPTNQAAAKARGLRWAADRKVYVDADGCPALDQFGQVLG